MAGLKKLDRARPGEPPEDGAAAAAPQSRKSAVKRDAIMRAAIEVINTKSFALATMTEIAATLDLRDATLYYYFPNKRALAYACHRRSLQRLERLVHAAEESTANGAEKVREVIHGMLIDSERNGPLLYFGDYSYLDAAQRIAIADSADRLKNTVEQFIRKGMKDGSVVECEPELIVQLLLGMLIWLGKWVPSIPDITVNRLTSAIDAFSFHGLASRAVTGSKRRR